MPPARDRAGLLSLSGAPLTRWSLIAALALFVCVPAQVRAAQGVRVARAAVEPQPITPGQAPRTGEYAPEFDALHYDIHVAVPDSGSVIEGQTEIQIAASAGAPATLALDFTGLRVTRVRVNGSSSRFTHEDGKLLIPVGPTTPRSRRLRVAVEYSGTPDDGLLIRDNIYGRRTAFVDNWPNRARFWFPALDQPADKATASFSVLVPAAWEVIANGVRVGAPAGARPGDTRRLFRWRITRPISTYNMVFGAADFRVRRVGRPCLADRRCIEVSTWLFPESAERADPSFRRAAEMVDYFSQLIAPFPYAKLAHVQSSTQFGGMENATAIFYAEKPLAEGRDLDDTVAHETAHQWFGDAVTEADWHHLWLSEGFATYFAALFIEHADGVDRFRSVMEAARQKIVASQVVERPVVDPGEADLFKLLNTNNYEKGGWILHMLRGLVGDAKFFDGIRRYYRRYEHRTAVTADVQRAMEDAAGVTLDAFFRQWVFSPGFPRLQLTWRWNAEQHIITGAVEQTQRAAWPTFRFPVTLEVTTASGKRRQLLDVDERVEAFSIPTDAEPLNVALDPDGWLLKEVETHRVN